MLKQLKANLPLFAIAGVSALSLGIVAALVNTVVSPEVAEVGEESAGFLGLPSRDPFAKHDPVLGLALQTPGQRQEALASYVEANDPISRSRSQYLLAQDLINADRGGSAVPLLEGLDAEYPTMAPYSLMALEQAHRAAGQTEAAQQTQQQLLSEFGEDGAIAPLLYRLGQQDPAYGDQLLGQFPDHPRSVDVAHQRLTADPHRADALPLLLIIARAGLHHPQAGAALVRLKTEFADQLQPEDWQTVGFGFWRRSNYAEAGPAYANAPVSARNLYRAARGLQIGNQRDRAIALFNQLDQQFPDHPDTGLGLMRLTLSLSDEAKLGVLDQVVNRFPERAAAALLMRANILDSLDSPSSAQTTREIILQDYSDSDAAAEIRWTNARNAADQGDLATAINWGRQVLAHSPDSETAAEAGFWTGRWAHQLGEPAVAQEALEQVIAFQPESYYAWRAAAALGWDVGDFKTVRAKVPAIAPPERRAPLPVGSDQLQELYLLGQDQKAWERWQLEYTNRQDPSSEERFVDGLMRQGVGDHLDGIYQVSSLAWDITPEEQAAFAELAEHPDYWHGVYPMPYRDLIETWSAQRQLNPLLVAALIRQESRFMPSIRSGVGAAGLMQVMPGTAAWIKDRSDIDAYNLDDPLDNIKLGTWYLDYTHREYNNHSLFAVASYNAGPGNIARWIERGGFTDDDDFAEKIPFPETHGYVRAVFGGYWNYLRLYDPAIAQAVEQLQRRHAG